MACMLGLDVGTRTIGVARAESGTAVASPVVTLARRSVKKDAAEVARLCGQHQATTVVVGLPRLADGSEGRSARLARQVGEAVATLTGLPVHYQDERYSTAEAEARLAAAGVSTRRQREVIDQVAAVVILEEWLVAAT